jgi:CDP-4-dehydro-6-deoxyglucose reductase, E3
MASVRYEGLVAHLGPGETVLDGLLRCSRSVPHSCRVGACQSCLMRSVEGTPSAAAQAGLNDAQKAQGYFLACAARPSGDLEVDLGGEGLGRTRVRVGSIEPLSGIVVRVRLEPEGPFDNRPGQFLTLIRDDGLARSYSIASLPGRDRHIELHIRVLAAGRMSRWLAEEARPGVPATVQGPSGHCFYVPGWEGQELVLAGTGTGLAPLYGIAQDAIRNGHEAPITLFHGARDPGGLNLADLLRELERRERRFWYVPCSERDGGRDGIEEGSLEDVLPARFPSFAGRRVYLCGNPAMVQSLRKKVFLKGAGIKEIFADAFLSAPAQSS